MRLTARTLELREVTILPWDNSGPMEDSLQLARIHLPALVARGHAELIEGLKEQKLPSGAIVLSTAFADKARDESYIVFVNVAPSGRTTELTIRLEGIGEAAKLISTFRAYANSAHWTNEAEENPSAHDEVITIELKFGGN